jgi:hypothetical protein
MKYIPRDTNGKMKAMADAAQILRARPSAAAQLPLGGGRPFPGPRPPLALRGEGS